MSESQNQCAHSSSILRHLTVLGMLFLASLPLAEAQRAGDEITYPADAYKKLDTFEALNLEDADKLYNKKDYKGAAAAYKAYKEMRRTTNGELPLYLQGTAAEIAKVMQERARKAETWEGWMLNVIDWMDDEVGLGSIINDFATDYYSEEDGHYRGHVVDETTVQRVAFTQAMVYDEAFGFHGKLPNNAQADMIWNRAMDGLREKGWETGDSVRIGGKKARWVIRPDITPEERRIGFRVLRSGEARGSADTQFLDDGDSII